MGHVSKIGHVSNIVISTSINSEEKRHQTTRYTSHQVFVGRFEFEFESTYALLSQKNEPKARKPNKMTNSETHKNKKVVIGDNPVQYPDGAMTMDEDCDRG